MSHTSSNFLYAGPVHALHKNEYSHPWYLVPMILLALVAGEATIVVTIAAGTITHRYADGYLESVRDLPAVEGPLYYGLADHGYTRMWFSRGLVHRGGDKPAIEYIGCQIDNNTDIAHAEWFEHGLLHRDGGPAVVCHGQAIETWATHGACWKATACQQAPAGHTAQAPAGYTATNAWIRERVASEGDTALYQCGRLHCGDGPAIVRANGDREWWRHGKPHHGAGEVRWRDDAYMGWAPHHVHKSSKSAVNLFTPAVERTNGDREWYVEGEPFVCSSLAGFIVEFGKIQCHLTPNKRLPSICLPNGNLLWYTHTLGISYIANPPPPVFSFRSHELSHFQGLTAGVVYYNGIPRRT